MAGRNLKLLVTTFKAEGFRAVLHRIAFRFLHVHTFTVYRLRLSAALPEGRIPEDIELREVSVEQLRDLRKGRTDLPEYFYRDESDTTAERCWVGLKDGWLGFIAWISYRGSSGMVRVGAHEAEMAYIYCLSELRGQRLTANALFVIMRTLYEEGTTAILAVPHYANPPMIKSFLACGFVPIGTIRRFGFFTWPRTPVDVTNMPDPGVAPPGVTMPGTEGHRAS